MIKQLLSISVIVTLVACASQPRIETDKDIEYDLSSYQSFKIEEPELTNSPSQIGLNPILVQRVERAIKSRLEAKGLKESEEADMVVRFFIGTNREVDRSTDVGGRGFYNDRYWNSRNQKILKVDKDEIAIRFHDKETDDVIWYAFSRFNRSLKMKDQDAINSLIEKAILNF
jgi:hypothetical protein